MDPLALLFRWTHIAAVLVAVGGSFFLRFVLMPSAAALPDEPHQALRAGVLRRWKLVVRPCILLILISGGSNYFFVTRAAHAEQPAYHVLILFKFILALAVFTIAEGLIGRAPPFEFLRRDPSRWLAINLALAAAVVAISGYLKLS